MTGGQKFAIVLMVVLMILSMCACAIGMVLDTSEPQATKPTRTPKPTRENENAGNRCCFSDIPGCCATATAEAVYRIDR